MAGTRLHTLGRVLAGSKDLARPTCPSTRARSLRKITLRLHPHGHNYHHGMAPLDRRSRPLRATADTRYAARCFEGMSTIRRNHRIHKLNWKRALEGHNLRWDRRKAPVDMRRRASLEMLSLLSRQSIWTTPRQPRISQSRSWEKGQSHFPGWRARVQAGDHK